MKTHFICHELRWIKETQHKMRRHVYFLYHTVLFYIHIEYEVDRLIAKTGVYSINNLIVWLNFCLFFFSFFRDLLFECVHFCFHTFGNKIKNFFYSFDSSEHSCVN